MRIGEICCVGGAIVTKRFRDYEMESSDEGFYTTTYHRRTHLSGESGMFLKTVKSSQPCWIAVKVQEKICLMPAQAPLEKSDLFKMFSSFTDKPQAIVSFILDTSEFPDGGGYAASLAEFNEIRAINFLQKRLYKSSDLKYHEAIQITRDAFHMFSGDIKYNEFKTYVEKRKKFTGKDFNFQDGYNESKRTEVTREKFKCKEISFQDAYNESKRTEVTHEKIKCTYNRETQIWCGGWDSQLLMQSFGFSWIAVQGKDSICVVTQDEVGKGFLEYLSYHLEVYPLFGRNGYVGRSSKRSSIMSPFAVVSVAVGLNKADAEKCNVASIAEIKAAQFLGRQMKNVPSFTLEITVETATTAFTYLTQKDLNKEIQVCVLGDACLPVIERITFHEAVKVNEVVKRLQRRMKPRKTPNGPRRIRISA